MACEASASVCMLHHGKDSSKAEAQRLGVEFYGARDFRCGESVQSFPRPWESSPKKGDGYQISINQRQLGFRHCPVLIEDDEAEYLQVLYMFITVVQKMPKKEIISQDPIMSCRVMSYHARSRHHEATHSSLTLKILVRTEYQLLRHLSNSAAKPKYIYNVALPVVRIPPSQICKLGYLVSLPAGSVFDSLHTVYLQYCKVRLFFQLVPVNAYPRPLSQPIAGLLPAMTTYLTARSRPSFCSPPPLSRRYFPDGTVPEGDLQILGAEYSTYSFTIPLHCLGDHWWVDIPVTFWIFPFQISISCRLFMRFLATARSFAFSPLTEIQ